MKKFDWDKPITWRSYGKFSIICMLISFLIGILEVCIMLPEIPRAIGAWISEKFYGLKSKIKYKK